MLYIITWSQNLSNQQKMTPRKVFIHNMILVVVCIRQGNPAL